MEKAGSSSLPVTNNKRVPHTLCAKAPFVHAKPNGASLHTRVKEHDRCDISNEKTRGSGSSSALPQLSIHDVSCAKRRWIRPPDFQSKSPEPIHKNRTFQSNQCVSGTRFSTKERLALQSGSFTSILSSAHGSRSQTIFTSSVPRPTPSNDLPPLWPLYGTKGICCPDQLGSSNNERTRFAGNSVPRRLPDCSSGQNHFSESSSDAPGLFTRPGMANKFGEIHHLTTAKHHLPRNSLESVVRSKSTTKGQDLKHHQENPCVTKKRQTKHKRPKKRSRSTKLCKFCSSKRQTSLPSCDCTSEPATKDSMPKQLRTTSRRVSRPEMVAPQLPTIVTYPPATTKSLCDDGCLRCSLGCSIGWDTHIRPMVRTGETSALQYQRNASAIENIRTLFPFADSFDHSISVRQSDSGIVFKKPRRHTITATDEYHKQNFLLSRVAPDTFSRLPHTRAIQQSRRPSIPAQGSTGMAPFTSMYREGISEIRHPSDRLICLSESTRGSKLRNLRSPRRGSSVPRCLFSNVVVSPSMGICAAVPNTESPKPSQYSDRNLSTSGSSVAPSILAARLEISGVSGTIHNNPAGAETNRRSHGATSSKSQPDDPRNMEVWGWSTSLNNWETEQIKLLQSSWRPSTRKTYQVAWNRWLSWAKDCDEDPLNPTGSILAKFLADLHIKYKLSYSTILVHKSVVATLCNSETADSLSAHVLVKHILKSISLQKPITQKPPVWDIDKLVSFLLTTHIDDNNLFYTSRHTAALLLLCSGRRIHDLTLLAVDPDHYKLNSDSIVLWPTFGSKTDNSDYRQSGWRLTVNPENTNLCPVYWIKKTVTLLENRRKLMISSNLFVSVKGQPKPASRTLIAGWIKSLLKEAGITATPGSFRSAVGSKNWANNMPIDEILSRGNWRSGNTFTRFYRREVLSSNGNNNCTLVKCFNPVV